MNTEVINESIEVTDIVVYKRIRACESAIKKLTTVRDLKRDYLNKLHGFNQNRYSEYTRECNTLQSEIIELELELGSFHGLLVQLRKNLTL